MKQAAKPRIRRSVPSMELLWISLVLIGGVFAVFAAISLYSTLLAKLGTGGFVAAIIIGILIGAGGILLVAATTINACSEVFSFLRSPDDPSSFHYLLSLLQYRRAGPFILVEKGEAKVIPQPAGSRASGAIQVAHGSAAVMERRGDFSRVLTKGFYQLLPFESCRVAVDLTLQQKDKESELFSRDGIKLHSRIRVQFQLQSGGRTPTPADMYPVLEAAVVNAVYSVPDWKEHTIESAVILLRSMVADCYLGQFYDPTHTSMEENSSGMNLDVLQERLQTRLAENSFKWGVKINSLVVEITPLKEIESQALTSAEARAENQRIKEFTKDTGGSASDYALLQLSRQMGKAGVVPPQVEKLLTGKIQKSN